MGCFQFLAVTNNVIMNILVIMKISLGNCASVLAKLIPMIRISQLNSIDIFCFNRVYQIAFEQVVPIYNDVLEQYMATLGLPQLNTLGVINL